MSTIGRISDFQVEKWLTDLDQCYLALHYDNPDVAGAYASEVFGGGYTRCFVRFTPPSNRVIWNQDPAKWSGMPSVLITHIAGWDARIAGNYLFSMTLSNPIRVLAGKQILFGPNEIAISLD